MPVREIVQQVQAQVQVQAQPAVQPAVPLLMPTAPALAPAPDLAPVPTPSERCREHIAVTLEIGGYPVAWADLLHSHGQDPDRLVSDLATVMRHKQ